MNNNKEYLMAPKSEDCEVFEVRLSKEKTPIAFKKKVEELMEQGAFESREEAEKWVAEEPITLEIVYEKHSGLFAVESDALECGGLISPYSGKELICEED